MSDYIERYWRDATPIDAIKKPPMLARFRDGDEFDWHIDYLAGVRSTHDYPWFSFKLNSHKHCQVYDAPDPGEGWRLIDPEKDDYNQNGVEYWNRGAKLWLPRDQGHDMTSFCSGAFYRIRIEPPKPKYVPFTWEDREQLKGRWIKYKNEDGARIETQISHFSEHRREGFWFQWRNPKWLLENATFLDTGEPVGKRVAQ